MNSPNRCRIRDLVSSCFNTCRLSLHEDEEAGISSSTAPPKRSNNETNMKAPDFKKRSKENAAQSTHNTNGDGGGGWRAAEAETCFAEEDYIVFCFGEDGEIHMISDTKSASENMYTKISQKEGSEAPAADAAATPLPCITRKGEEEMKINGVEQSKMDSFESCDSNLSESSTTSFAFPIVGVEWIGSPLLMPNTAKRDPCRRCCSF